MMDSFDNLAQHVLYFAPGCKLLQQHPEAVQKIYHYLRVLFGSQVHLYRRCCQQKSGDAFPKEALFVTLCPTCLMLYGEQGPVRDFWTLYEAYQAFYSLGSDEAPLRQLTQAAFTAV